MGAPPPSGLSRRRRSYATPLSGRICMQLGCNTVLFSTVDLATALTHIAWAGYQHVELAAVAGMCEHVSPAFDPAGVREVRRMLADQGLEATAMEAATTDRARLEALFGLAGDLGVPIVNIGSGGVTGDEESTGQAIAHIGELARLAGRYGVRLAVKPHVGQAIYNGATALRLMKEFSLTSAYGGGTGCRPRAGPYFLPTPPLRARARRPEGAPAL